MHNAKKKGKISLLSRAPAASSTPRSCLPAFRGACPQISGCGGLSVNWTQAAGPLKQTAGVPVHGELLAFIRHPPTPRGPVHGESRVCTCEHADRCILRK